ncbi:Ca2+-binding RTX toxin-like protein [Loktanella sp. PT4BL]|jgi:Ca2+-binding RTX toxin-like protein|uniref:beta strand repeat-containing protein n=1 Tax=Loktanella sp. PT4BL TaxID=2135611 RepID=UPI000D76D1A9|nr:hypothetical protein [Loktanella sp. PT4BL]PXW67340.1 Ca2+-binding RTX toxin-like protein [Loktanella sp. PT4BL]
MAVFRSDIDEYLWWIFNGFGDVIFPWERLFSGQSAANDLVIINTPPTMFRTGAAMVDLFDNATSALPKNQDHVVFGQSGDHVMALRNVEYVSAYASNLVDFYQLDHFGFTTDGSIRVIEADIGNHLVTFETAARDSSLILGDGFDRVIVTDDPDVGIVTYWTIRRELDNSVKAYALSTGNVVEIEGGDASRWATNPGTNYGEVERLTYSEFRTGDDVDLYLGKGDIGSSYNRAGFENIDLSTYDMTSSPDTFLHASFGSINFSSRNVFTGAAVIEEWNGTEETAEQQSAAYRFSTTSILAVDHNHDLLVAQQTDEIDGHLRLYVRDETSRTYNRFNEVYLGTNANDVNANTGSTTSRNGTAEQISHTALYGFDGNDTLQAGAGNDYLFGGTSTYSTIVITNNLGNQVTGGVGSDHFGVGNVVSGAKGDVIMTTSFAGRLSGTAPSSSSDTGKISRLDTSDSPDLVTRVGTDRITDWTAGVDYLRVLANGTAVIEGLGSANGAGGAYVVDTIGNEAERIDISGGRVNNEGKIVARGLGGVDTLIGSAGNDWLYGNASTNYYSIGQGGNDRVYVDQFDGSRSKHYVSGFTRSTGSAEDRDLVMLNKKIIDAFYSGGAGRSALKLDVDANYTAAQAKSGGINYLYNSFYSGSYASNNATHDAADGGAYWEGGTGADGTSSFIGLGMAIAGRGMFAIPFVGPIIGGAMIAASIPIEGLGFDPSPTREHRNATYDGVVNAYLNVLTDSYAGNGVTLNTTVGVNDTGVRFLDFFQNADAGDGYLPVVEFTANSGGIYGYFALHSDDETFVYLVASSDNMVENSEAIFVAEVDGRLRAADFGIYNGEQDVYNYGIAPTVVIRTPTVTNVRDSATPTADTALDDGVLADVINPILISGNVSGDLAAGSYFRVYDGPTKIYDGDTPVSAPQVTLNLVGTNFTFTDSRALGTTVENTTKTGTNDTFVLADAYVRYTVELVDGETGIPTRVSVRDIKVSGGNAIIDGGGGSDILLVTETSTFLNNISEVRLIGMETIVLAGAVTIVDGVQTPTPINLSLANQSEGFEVFSGDAGDTIVGSSGNDTIFGVGGADSIITGISADVVVYSTSYQVVTTLVGEVETNTTTDTILSSAAQNLAADVTVDGGDGVDTLRFDTDRYDGSTLMFSAPVAISDVEFAKVIRFENLVLNGTGTQAVTLEANANTAFANGITVTTAATATSLNFDASNASWTRTAHVTGTNNADTITGGSANDTLIGGAGNDTITGGAGSDNLSGGNDADTFVLADNLTSADTITGGDDGTNTDTLTFTDANGAADELNNVTGIETITLGNTTTNVVVTTVDALVASGATLTVNGSSLTTGTMTWNGAAETNGKFSITGGGAADTIIGSAGNDTIDGGVGADSITAGAGNDSLLGGAGNDTFVLGVHLTSADTISGEGHSDTLTFTDANGAADDLNNVTGIETIILGNTTTDVVVTTVNAMLIAGTSLTVNGTALTTGTLTWDGSAETNATFNITGGDAADTITGGSVNDTISGGTGNDVITGRGGLDSLDGGAGNDVFVFASAAELAADFTVIGGSETDTIRMDTGSTALTLADADFADVIQVENLDLTGTAAQTVTLGAQTNEAFASGITITTNATAASLNLQGSASTVSINATGTNNADTLVGGSANDTLDAGSGGGSVSGGDGADTIYWSGTGNTTIVGGDGDDFVDPATGQTGADSIDGGAGNDTIYGGGGSDTILGGIGNDNLIGEDGSNVLWGGQGADTISANNGAIDTVIMVGDLSTADATKLADVNATLDALMGYNYPDVGTGYVSDVDPSDAIAFDTTSGITDVLYTFGTLDLSGLNIQGSYSIVAHSKITLTESQLNAATSITFVGASSHEIVVVNDDLSAIDGMDQQVIVESWADQGAQQLKFLQGNAAATATGMTVGGNNYLAASNPVSPMLIDEKFETPVRSAVAAGSPFVTSAGVQNLRWDNANVGGTIANFALSGDEFITTSGRASSKRVEINDRFAGANFITYFEPGYTQLPIPSTFGSFGDDAVHREQFEVFNGSYDVRTGIFTVERSPDFGTSTRTEYTLIIYDDDPAATVGDVEGIVVANQLLERSGWSTVSPRTANAKLQYGNTALDNSGSYNYIYGTVGNNGALTTTADIDYIYALDGNDYLTGGAGDFLFAGTGADTVVSGTGENLIDLGYTLATWSTGDDAQDIVIVGAGTSQLAGANAYGHLTGQDYVYNFEFDLDILRVVKTGVANFNHAVNTTLGGASTTSGQTAAAFSGTTLTVDLDANGTLGSGDVVVTFDQYHATLGTGRVQYDLLGTSGNDVIVGGGLNDTIRGDDGDDTLTGGAGADSLSGGNGNDLLLFATVSDVLGDLTVRGDSGTDTIRIASQITTAVNLGTQAPITSVERLELMGGSTAYVTPDTSMTQIVSGAAGLVQLSATGQAVTGSAGNDTVKVITGVSSSSDLMGGTNTVVVTDGANISAATFTATGGTVGYDLDLARTTTMTIAQHALITSAAGSNIVTLSDAADTNGISSIEAYVLAGGDQRFTLAFASQDVTTGSGHVVIDTGPTLTAFVATYDYFDNGLGWQRNVTSPEFSTAADALQFVLDQKQASHHPDPILQYTTQVQPTMDAVINGTAATSLSINLGSEVDLSTAVITGVNGNQDADYTITIDENINATMTVAQNALITSAGGFNIVTLSNAGIATGFGGVEAYVLADGTNTFTMVAGNRTVTGGTGDDIVEGSSMADSITLGGGDDIVVISAATDAAFETYEGGDHVNGDTIRVTGTGNVDLSNDSITAFEKMDLGTDTGAQSVTMSISQRIALSDISAIAQDVVTVKGVFDNSLDYTALAQGNATIILDDSDNSVTIDVTDADNMRTGGAKFASNDTITIAATEAVLASVFATPANYSTTALGGAAMVLNDSVDNTITINTDQFSALSAQGIKFAPTEDIILTGVYGTATDWSLWTTTQIGGNSVTLDDSDDLVTIDPTDLALMNIYGQTFVLGDDVTLTTGSTTDISSILWIDNLTASSNNIDLTGNSGPNVLIGNNGFNQLAGGVGNDTLTGGGGKDTLLGGDGDDTLVVNGTADIAAGEIYDGGNDNGDVLSVTATTNFSGVQSITNIETILLADGVATTFDAQTLSGQTMQIVGTGDNGGESLTVNGTASNNIINLSGITVDGNDITGAVINGLDGNDTIIGTNGADTITGGAGADVFKYTDTGDTTTTNTISQMDVIEGFNITEDSFDLSSLGAVSGLTATVDPTDTDSYVISWTSGGVTNYVYVKDTGVTGGLTLTNNGSGSVTATATAAPALAISLISVSSTGITTQGDGPHRAYFTQGDTAPIRNDSTTYYTQSTNVGASTNYTFALADIDAADSTVRVGHVAIQETNTGVNTYLDAHVYIGGATDTNDTIVADISGGLTTLNYAIVYAQGGDDTVTGSTGNDYIFGGSGNDVIDGNGGVDMLVGGIGNDVFIFVDDDAIGVASKSSVQGGDGTDRIKFTSALNTIPTLGGDGNFHAVFSNVSSVEEVELTGASNINLGETFVSIGVPKFITGTGSTTIRYDDSALGMVTVDAAQMADGNILTLTKFNADAVGSFNVVNLQGDVNASTLTGALSVTAASGSGFATSITGGSGDDALTGGTGNDTISGGAGNDVIDGGLGDDRLAGGAGSDVFRFSSSGNGLDTITDFVAADGDVLDFSSITDQHDVYNSGTAVAEGSSGEITLASVNGRFVYLSVADVSTADISEASLFGSGQEFAAEGTPSPLDFVLAVGETSGTDGVKIYQVFDGADPNDMTITQIGLVSSVSLADIDPTNNLDLGTAPTTNIISTFTVDNTSGDQIVTGSPAFGTRSGYQNITNFDTSAGDRIEISNLSLSAGRSFDGTLASISVVNTDSSWGAAGGSTVEGSAISSSAAILKATGTALGMDNIDPTLAGSLAPPLDYAFDLTSLLDQESLIVLIEADDLDNDASTTQSWLALYRNEGIDDSTAGSGGAADFQYLALISYESTDVLDQTSFIFT